MNWIDVNKELPEFYKNILVYYSDKDGSNEEIMFASLQPKFYSIKNNYWLEGDNLKGEIYSESDSIVRYWFDYQEYLDYPNVSESN